MNKALKRTIMVIVLSIVLIVLGLIALCLATDYPPAIGKVLVLIGAIAFLAGLSGLF